MITGETDLLNRDPSVSNAFIERASGRLAGVRNGILIFDEDRSYAGDVEVSLRNLELLARDAVENERLDLAERIDYCDSSIRSLLGGNASPTDIGRSLDSVARIQEALLQIPLASGNFLEDISSFVDSSFELLQADQQSDSSFEEVIDFDIDDETLEIFRAEASELLRNISVNVGILRSDSDDRDALWEVRRNAHTFKGAAGIVGLTCAAKLAHRVEDLLDKMVETNAAVDAEIVDLLTTSAKRLEIFSLGTNLTDVAGSIDVIYSEFERIITSVPKRRSVGAPVALGESTNSALSPAAKVDPLMPAATPIVRVSLDRLDDLIALSSDLLINRSEIVQLLGSLAGPAEQVAFGNTVLMLRELLDDQHVLADVLQERLARIRMVRFGTLETRLARAVHVTCEEENKSAAFSIENGECEIDTQVIDALVEPLLHLLKNAVVHGIENPETRRMIGKPEKGRIQVEVRSDRSGTTITVSDDGRGISVSRLKQKAIARDIVTPEAAAKMSEADAFELIFERGLTTAERLNLNAGRGIGMSIVKEGIESQGGLIRIRSEPQKGTIFTVEMPLTVENSRRRVSVIDPVGKADHVGRHGRDALVLVIDDSASVRRQTAKFVETAGHRVITAVNGADAIELLLSNALRPDLIMSDVEMPVMDGWEFLERVRSSDDLSAIPVVMVTSLSAMEHVKKAFQLGASDYRIKPLCAPDVAELIGSVLKTKSTI